MTEFIVLPDFTVICRKHRIQQFFRDMWIPLLRHTKREKMNLHPIRYIFNRCFQRIQHMRPHCRLHLVELPSQMFKGCINLWILFKICSAIICSNLCPIFFKCHPSVPLREKQQQAQYPTHAVTVGTGGSLQAFCRTVFLGSHIVYLSSEGRDFFRKVQMQDRFRKGRPPPIPFSDRSRCGAANRKPCIPAATGTLHPQR